MKMMAMACAPFRAAVAAAAATCRRIDRRADACRRPACARRPRGAVAVGDRDEIAPQAPGRRRSRRRISSTSRKPRVVMTPMLGPRRSSSVLVPTVVPWTIEPMPAMPPSALQALRESPPPRRRAATAPWRCGTRRVAASSKNRSVNVPPTSTPTIDHGAALMRAAARACAVAGRVDTPSSREHDACSRATPPARET